MYDKTQDIAQQLLHNCPPGTEISFVSQGEMAHNPHYSAQNGWHCDGHHAVVLPNSQIAVDKFHVPMNLNNGN